MPSEIEVKRDVDFPWEEVAVAVEYGIAALGLVVFIPVAACKKIGSDIPIGVGGVIIICVFFIILFGGLSACHGRMLYLDSQKNYNKSQEMIKITNPDSVKQDNNNNNKRSNPDSVKENKLVKQEPERNVKERTQVAAESFYVAEVEQTSQGQHSKVNQKQICVCGRQSEIDNLNIPAGSNIIIYGNINTVNVNTDMAGKHL